MLGFKSAFKIIFVMVSIFAFTCAFAADAHAVTKTATITYPNGGELWKQGSSVTITWSNSGFGNPDKVKLSLSTDGGATYSTDLAPGATVKANSGSYTVVVPALASTQCRVRISTTDGVTTYDVSDANFRINAIPVLGSVGNQSVDENAALSFTISATDADSGTLIYSASNLPAGSSFDPSTLTFSWTPDYTQANTYANVHFEVSDGTDIDSEDITITVNNVNRAPVLAAIGDQVIDEGATLTITPSATDPDGDPLSPYIVSNLPDGATFDLDTHTFTWTPAYNQAGQYAAVTFEVNDGWLIASESITITVNNLNAPPVLNAIGDQSVDEGASLTIGISATDPDTIAGPPIMMALGVPTGDSLTYSASNLPEGASFDTGTQIFTWTPGYNQAGQYAAVHFEVTDGLLTDSEDIIITVNDVNGPPVLAPIGDKSVLLGQALSFTISATDANGDPLTYSATGLPTGATFDVDTQTFTMDPAYEAAGTSTTVHFEVSDGTTTDSEDVKIEVKSNTPIVAANLDGNATDELIVDFGAADGVWILYNNVDWVQLHNISPELVVVGNVDGDINGIDDIIVDFGDADGIWIYYNNSTWQQLHNVSAKSIVTGNVDGDVNGIDDIIVDFGDTYGIWIYYNNSTWQQLHNVSAKQIVTADLDNNGQDDITIDFGSTYGIWMRSNDLTWTQLHTVTPDSMIIADLGANGKYLVMDFGASYGVWATKGDNNWEQYSADNLESATAADMDGDGFDDVVGDMSTGFGARYYADGLIYNIHRVSP